MYKFRFKQVGDQIVPMPPKAINTKDMLSLAEAAKVSKTSKRAMEAMHLFTWPPTGDGPMYFLESNGLPDPATYEELAESGRFAVAMDIDEAAKHFGHAREILAAIWQGKRRNIARDIQEQDVINAMRHPRVATEINRAGSTLLDVLATLLQVMISESR